MIYLNGTSFIHNDVVNNYLLKLDKSTNDTDNTKYTHYFILETLFIIFY